MVEREAITVDEALELAVDTAGQLMRLEGEHLRRVVGTVGVAGDWSETLVIVHDDARTGVVRGLADADARNRSELAAALVKAGVRDAVVACCYYGAAWEVNQDRAVVGMPLDEHPERREVLRVLAVARGGRTLGLRGLVDRSEEGPRVGAWASYEPEVVGDWLLEALKGVVEL